MTGIACGLAVLAGGMWGWSAPVVLAASCIIARLARASFAGVLIVCTGLAVLATLRVGSPAAVVVPTWLDGNQTFLARVAGAPVDNGSRQSFVVIVETPGGNSTTTTETRVCVTAPPLPRVNRGDWLQVGGNVRSLEVVDDQTADWLRFRNCAGELTTETMSIERQGSGLQRIFDRLRRRMTDALQAAAPGDSGALLAGLATGDDSALTLARRNDFIVTGTSHVTAISGSNLSFLVAMVAAGTSILGSARSPWKLVVIVVVIWSYDALVGWPPSATRAASVATLALVARAIGRRPDFVTLAVIAAAVETLVRPTDLHSLAFQLSTVSSIAIVLGMGGRSPAHVSGWFRHGITSTALTQAATAALLVPTFGRLSIYAIPANLIIGPLCTAAFPLALLAGLVGLASSTAAAAFAFPPRLFADIVLFVVSTCADLPFTATSGDLPTWAPSWLWVLFGMGVVVAMSRECQGGLSWLVRRATGMNARQYAVAAGAAWGTCLGLLAFVLTR